MTDGGEHGSPTWLIFKQLYNLQVMQVATLSHK